MINLKNIVCVSGLLLSVALSHSAIAGGDIEAGKEKSATCAACHGADGNSTIAGTPSIGGQYKDYIIQALSDYQDGDRKNPIMSGMAANLSDQDIDDLAAYFSSQEGLFTPDEDQW